MSYEDTDMGLPGRFWAKVRKGEGPDACWEWTGCLSSGYGRIGIRKRTEYAHRLVLETTLGRVIEKGKETLHSCDNRRCVRPKHLSEGTRKENVGDCKSKGRFKTVIPDNRGEAHGHAKLTDEQVRWAMTAKVRQRDVARALGVHQSVVSRIRGGRAWKHITCAEATR